VQGADGHRLPAGLARVTWRMPVPVRWLWRRKTSTCKPREPESEGAAETHVRPQNVPHMKLKRNDEVCHKDRTLVRFQTRCNDALPRQPSS
jgi:hypothetical protein